MAEEQIEQEARKMGWVPKEDFRGAEDRWVDADTFVERGHTVMPLLKKQKEELQTEVQSLREETARLQTLFNASQESIQALQEFHSENTKRQVKAARENILAELKQAKKDGDTDLEVDLMDELQKANDALKQADKAPALSTPQTKPTPVDPHFAAWVDQNKWFGTDIRKTNLAYSIASALRAAPENDELVGTDFYKRVDAELAARASGGPTHSKVGSGDSSSSGHNNSGGKGYESLPTDAKRICDADAKRFVGEGRMFKTVAEYRKFYAAQVQGE
jgi:DNA repair exonuclease SbcCD ATPase subunit